MTIRRLYIGTQFRVASENSEGIELESRSRLRPGEVIEVVRGQNGSDSARRAAVVTWAIARLGQSGPTYAGLCRWQ
jgi:hypothetical protein